jgi:hypothetical protein
LKLSFLDIPKLHSFTSETAADFFEALADTDDMKFFETHAVKKLIEFKWPLIFEYTVKKLFVPFFFLLAFFLVLMHTSCYMESKRNQPWAIFVFFGVISLSVYLLSIEIY